MADGHKNATNKASMSLRINKMKIKSEDRTIADWDWLLRLPAAARDAADIDRRDASGKLVALVLDFRRRYVWSYP